jgi:S1-C subfamily serine protease
VAIGNALGQFQNTVTSGIISGFGRNVQASDGLSSDVLQNLLQTDAAINEGNSGGPLVGLNGQVIGINTAVAGGGAENIGFAIPIDDIKGLITSVLEEGKLERPYLGVRYVQLTDDLAARFELETKRGAYIMPHEAGEEASVLPNSPAAKAGLREGDVITKLSGEAVDDGHSLTALIGKHKVGEEITLSIVRDGKDQEVKVKLEASPQE